MLASAPHSLPLAKGAAVRRAIISATSSSAWAPRQGELHRLVLADRPVKDDAGPWRIRRHASEANGRRRCTLKAVGIEVKLAEAPVARENAHLQLNEAIQGAQCGRVACRIAQRD